MLLLLPLLEILVPSFMVQSQGFRVPMHQVKSIAARKPTLTIRSVIKLNLWLLSLGVEVSG